MYTWSIIIFSHLDNSSRMRIITNRFKFDLVEWISMIVHCLICLFFWTSYRFDLIPVSAIKIWTNGYFFILPLILIGLLFRNLRNVKYFIVWTIIGLIQLLVYFVIKDNPDFLFPRGTGLSGLKSLLPVLIIFQILRQISLKVYNREMIISIRHFRMTMYEEEDNRDMTWIEVLFSLILLASAIIFSAI